MNILFISLGCDKNLCDSQVMLKLLADSGHRITDDEYEADAVIINTCGFIISAKEESIDTIIRMNDLRKTGRLKYIIATGCMAERYKDEILSEMDEVDAILGTTSYDKIVQALDDCEKGYRKGYFQSIHKDPKTRDRLIAEGTFSAYMKIAEGCDKHCTYCAIPLMRGGYRSRPMEELIEEAEDLASKGVKELILVAQETTLYGIDLYDKKMLPELLRRLSLINGIEWIRLLYCYPEEITDDLIKEMGSNKKVLHYLDMPIQSGCDTVLKRMGRKVTAQKLREIINRLRENIEDIAIRTTIITGFPGETEEEHKSTMEFIEEMKFERLGVFTYSPEEGTPAYKMQGQVDEATKEKRLDDIMKLQQKISLDIGEKKTGQVLDVIIEGRLPEDDVYIGRSYMDAPDVDGYVFASSEEELLSGDIVKVKIDGAMEYDLTGGVVL